MLNLSNIHCKIDKIRDESVEIQKMIEASNEIINNNKFLYNKICNNLYRSKRYYKTEDSYKPLRRITQLKGEYQAQCSY